MGTGSRTHAVVLGGSIAGLAAARALSNHFERVTLVERDLLPDAVGTRKGVPQGEHAHGLLASGYRVLDAYFPEMMSELVSAGAAHGDVSGDFLWYQFGCWKLRADCGLTGIITTRPLLESAVRRAVRALANVTVLDNHDFAAPVLDATQGRVKQVAVKNRANGDSAALDVDLVVDASGRGSAVSKWLESWGFGEVPEETVKVDVGYATATFERRHGDLYGAFGAIVSGTPPSSRRYAAVLGTENNRWTITLVGTLRDYPPTEIGAWKEFARSLPTPDLFNLVKDRDPLGPVASFRFPANRRRAFSRLSRFPAGLLVLGDAMCSFNPLYGQGMSVALCQAKALDDVLSEGDEKLSERFFSRADALIDAPWEIAINEDMRYPEVEGRRVLGFSLIARYMERAHRATARDPIILRRFFDVANLLAPPSALLHPGIAWRVLVGGVGSPADGPANKVTARAFG